MEWIGTADAPAWAAFLDYALLGGPFDYYPDAQIAIFSTWLLEPMTQLLGYKYAGQYTEKFKFRLQITR